MSTKVKQEAQNPLILRAHRLMEAFTKSDDERDFYLDRQEGFIIYTDLDKPDTEITALESELLNFPERYCVIPKMTFYEAKKIMEGFVNEKVYDIDTKEKLLDIIQSKEARENFLEFIYDHHSELEKWQQFYQERSRIRIIEWLRQNHFHFVFEEDLDLTPSTMEKLKTNLFVAKAPKDVLNARKALFTKAKTYYSNEALNPRPKRGRPPKQTVKLEVEPQMTVDIYTTVPLPARPFLFTPDIASASAVTFSSKFQSEEQLLASRRPQASDSEVSLESIQAKLASLRTLTSRWGDPKPEPLNGKIAFADDEDDDDDEDEDFAPQPKKGKAVSPAKKEALKKESPRKETLKKEPLKKAPKKEPLKKLSAKKTLSSGKPTAVLKDQTKKVPLKKISLKKIPLKKTAQVSSKAKTITARSKPKTIARAKQKASKRR